MSSSNNGKGYLTVMLSNNGYHFRRYVHRLVAKAFIPNPENKPEVNHKNGIKDDNTAENLEWVTTKENMKHARDTGLIPEHGYAHTAEINKKISKTVKRLWKMGIYKKRTSEDWTPEQRERARQGQLNSTKKKRGAQHPDARRIRCIETGEVFDCIKFADKKYGGRTIKDAVRGRQKTAHGLHWEYV